MDWYWTWEGKCFGYRDGEELRTHDGKHVGRFYDEEIYDCNGNYLGEVKDGDRLITDTRKKNKRKYSFAPRMDRMSRMERMDSMGRMMRMGHEDFPAPEYFDNY